MCKGMAERACKYKRLPPYVQPGVPQCVYTEGGSSFYRRLWLVFFPFFLYKAALQQWEEWGLGGSSEGEAEAKRRSKRETMGHGRDRGTKGKEG